MKLGETLYVKDRAQWRRWLRRHHADKQEIWLVYPRKADGARPRIPYNDAVEEALCFGWIDSIMKPVDAAHYAQRYSPRKPKSQLSPMNRIRVERLIAQKKMTRAGLAALKDQLATDPTRQIPKDILAALKEDPVTWRHFRAFPESYRRIRVGWIDGARKRPAEFHKRLRYFLKMTRQNKRYGMVQ